MNNNKINFLKDLGYTLKNGTENILEKDYSSTIISIDLNEEKAIFDNNIFTIGRYTSSNLLNEENLSVLECIDNLLEIGYNPKDITLEKPFPSGAAGKDIYLDIMVKYPEDYYVKEKQNNAYMLIEVKRQSEYSKAIKDSYEVKKNGEPKSQLLSYFQLEKNAEIIVYYTSYDNGTKNRQYKYVNALEQKLDKTKNGIELYQAWNKTYYVNKGLFENDNSPYNYELPLFKKKDLIDLSNSEESRRIFYQFLTILRKNSISDKGNAFNKIFNLFICKIKDEDSKDSNDTLDFQWKTNDTEEALLNRLNDLYKQGILEYLNIKVQDTEEKDFNELINNINSSKKTQLKAIYNQLRLYKNNEFSFIEVFDEESFEKNAKIVKEIVLLLEKFRLRYNHKQQFLGDFFESLLNTGLKQENGQFFTPIPIARFIIKSLPLEKIIDTKMKDPKRLNGGLYEILPHSIDYAAGSGHFLTELMDEYNSILNQKKREQSFKGLQKNIKNTIEEYTNPRNLYNWAPEYIYGIEKDYRLSKTAKVACFLNGDGDANMLYADGLDSFSKSKTYIGKLKTDSIEKDNNNFDVIVANPPYSVKGFKEFMDNGAENFELFDKLGDDSDDIECLFMERTKQLLKGNGVAGIVLPTFIMDNDGVFQHMRNLLLKNFKFKSIVDMSSNGKVFSDTGVDAVILFLEKRDPLEYINIKEELNAFYSHKQDISINGNSQLIEEYSRDIYNFSFLEYIDLLEGNIFSINISEKEPEEFIVKDNKVYEEYWGLYLEKYNKGIFNISSFINMVKKIELEKLSIYVLNKNEKCLTVSFPENISELEPFLGYKFSKSKQKEGIQFKEDKEGNFLSTLYSETDKFDKSKLNYYIHKHLSDTNIEIEEIEEDLTQYINIKPFNSLLDFQDPNWIQKIKEMDSASLPEVSLEKINEVMFNKNKRMLSQEEELNITSIFEDISREPKIKLSEVINYRKKSKLPAASGSSRSDINTIPFFKSSMKVNSFVSEALYEEKSIIIGDGGKLSIHLSSYFSCSDHNFITYVKNEEKFFNEYVFYCVLLSFHKLQAKSKGSAGLKNISKKTLDSFEIPNIDLEAQRDFIIEISNIIEVYS